MKSDKMSFFGVEVERDCITKLPSFFRYDNRRWDYAIKTNSGTAKDFAMKLQSTGIFRTAQIPESGVWIIKEIRH
jgi:hypothetical protein|tara:strand:- start:3067 stop:3291 length:225 start_codon:yes stop_codon:yes gene_type:complete